MRFLYPVLILGILSIVIFTMVSSSSTGSSKETAEKFLNAVQKGDYKGTVELFGGNTCRCPKKGGWVSYLVYASAQEPNLAFLMGRPFAIGKFTETPIKHPDKNHITVLPWQQPEDVIVDVDLSFDESRYAPLFLPLKMAYGIPISETEFSKFTTNPDPDCWKGFVLRLRPSIAPGAIERPESSKGIEYKPTEKADDVNRSESLSMEDKQKLVTVQTKGKSIPLSAFKKLKPTNDVAQSREDSNEIDSDEKDDSFIYANVEDAIKETLGAEVAMYLHPRDAGSVTRDDGTKLSEEEVEKKLPRLQSAKLRLHVVRREQLKSWTVYHMSILEPVMKLSDGTTFPLKSYKTPSHDEVPNPEDSAPVKDIKP
jgi:hypothetical protein